MTNLDLSIKKVRKKDKNIYYSEYISESGTESETDDPDEEEIWECVEKKCKAVVKIKKDLVQTHTKHTCQISLKMEIDQEYGTLDGYIFRKDAGNNTGGIYSSHSKCKYVTQIK